MYFYCHLIRSLNLKLKSALQVFFLIYRVNASKAKEKLINILEILASSLYPEMYKYQIISSGSQAWDQ